MGLVTAKKLQKQCWEIWSPGNVFRLAFNEGIKISKLNKFYDGNKHLKT
jgi:hypothetical protein